jgi:PAS domain S-box-containing protein
MSITEMYPNSCDLAAASMDCMSDAAFWIRRDATFAFVNKAACQGLGYTAEELLAMSVRDVDRSLSDAAWQRHWEGLRVSGTLRFRSWHHRKSGDSFPVEITANLLTNQAGEFNLVIARDISEQQRLEESLSLSEARFRTMFEYLPDAAYLNSVDDHIVDANPAACRMLGYSVDELRTMHLRDIIAPEELLKRGKASQPIARSQSEKGGIITSVDVRRDGSRIPVEVNTRLFESREGLLYITVVRDISERVAMQQALEREMERAQQYLDVAAVIMIVLDREGRLTLVNRRGLELLEYQRDELIGASWFDTCLPERLRNEVKHVFQQVFAGTEPLFENYENPVLTRSGAERLVHWRNVVLWDEEGTPIAILSAGEDVTERRQAENALRQAYDQIERKVEERTAALSKANERLRQEIKQRRQALEALEESKEWLHLALQGADLGIWDWRAQGDGQVSMEHHWPASFGCDTDYVEFGFFDEIERIRPSDMSRVIRAFNNHLQGITPYIHVQYRARTRSGEWRWIFDRGQVLTRDTNGRPLRAAGTHLDTTDIMEADQEIRFSRTLSESIKRLSVNAVLTAACSEMARILDLPYAGVISSSQEHSHTFHFEAEANNADNPWGISIDTERQIDEDGEPIAPLIDEATILVEQGSPLGEMSEPTAPVVVEDMLSLAWPPSLKAALRQRGAASLVILPLWLTDEPRRFMLLGAPDTACFSEKIQQRAWRLSPQAVDGLRRAQAAISRQRLVAAIDQVSEAVVVTDRDGKILYANPAFQKSIPPPSGRVVGSRLRLYIRSDEDLEQFDRAWRTVLSGAAWKGRFLALPGNESAWIGDATISPISQHPGGASPVFVAILRDITRELRLEEQYRQAQKMEAIGQLAAGIAHEINTPTQYISSNVHFLQKSWEKVQAALQVLELLLTGVQSHNVPEELIEQTEKVLRDSRLDYLSEEIPTAIAETIEGVERVTGIVNAMREFSHPASEMPTPTDINRAIRSTVTVARHEWKYVAQVDLDLDPDLPLVPCLPGEFNQVILNLVVNAAHAIASAAQEDEGQTKSGTIRISTRRSGDWAEIRVKDNGSGIEEKHRSRIFEPFFTTKQVGSGTGQGLAMAHNIITTKHSGSITFETETGKGTEFIIHLPLSNLQEPEELLRYE